MAVINMQYQELKQELSTFAYDVYLCSYNAEDNIQQVIESILNQSIKPRMINVFDDNSTDYTIAVLGMLESYYDNLNVIYSNEKHEYDASRLPKNINNMLNTNDGYIMILSDDVILPKHYVESLAKHLIENPQIAIISGNENLFSANANSPRGSGRLIDSTFFNNSLFKGKFPEDISFESVLLFCAQYEGYDTYCKNDIKYRHIRENGKLTSFHHYGQSMKNAGYSIFYVLGRITKNIITQNEFPRHKALSILVQYINAKDKNLYPQELKSFICKTQNRRITQILKTTLINRFTIILYLVAIILSLSGVIRLR